MRHVTHIGPYSQVEPGTRKTSLQISYARIVISCHVCALPGVCSRVGSTPQHGTLENGAPGRSQAFTGGVLDIACGMVPCDIRTGRCPEPDSGPAWSCLRGCPGARVKPRSPASYAEKPEDRSLASRGTVAKVRHGTGRRSSPTPLNWRIIVNDITSSARKTHAKLNCTAFRAVWRPLPGAICMCAQAAGLHARRGSTAVNG